MEEEHEYQEYDILRWEAPEFEYKEKSHDWYWILGIIAVIGALIAVLLKDSLFAVFIVIGAFVMAIFASKHPDLLRIELNRRGMIIGGTYYPYKSLETFWVEDEIEGKERLFVTPNGTLSLQIVVPIQNIDPELVRDFLLDYVEEEEQGESLAERLMEYLHF